MATKNKKVKSSNEQYGMRFFEDEKFEKITNPFADVMKNYITKQIIIIAIIIALIVFSFININRIGEFFGNLISILSPVIFGWALTFIMSPLYNMVCDKIKKLGKNFTQFTKVIATVVCSVVVLCATIGLIFLIVPQLYSSITRFISRSSSYFVKAQYLIDDLQETSKSDIAQSILLQLEKMLDGSDGENSLFDFSSLASGIFTGFAFSLKAIINYFVGFVVMIYSLNMKEEICMGIKRALFAFTRKDVGFKLLEETRFAKQVFTGFFVGKLLDSIIVGIICYICCSLMKMPYTPLISIIVGVTNIIPFFGPFIGAIPSFILLLLEVPLTWKPYGFLIFIIVLQQLDGNVIGPKILGDKTGVGSFWVLFSILLFGGLFGFIGMIVAVPLWAVIERLFNELVVAKLRRKKYPITIDDYKNIKSKV